MKNKFYASLFIGIGLTLTSTPGLAKAAPPPAKKQVSSSAKSAKSAKTNTGSKKPEQSVVKKASSNTVVKLKSGQTKTHQKIVNAKDKPAKTTPHSLADAKDIKRGKSKSIERDDDKNNKYSKKGKSKTSQLADAKDNKHGKSSLRSLADAKNSRYKKSKSQQIAVAKANKHSRKRSNQVEEETSVAENEEEDLVAVVDENEVDQTAEETNNVDSEAVSDASNSEEYPEKNSELIATPQKVSPLFFQPLNKNSTQALNYNRSNPYTVEPKNPEIKPSPLFAAPTTANTQMAMANNNRVHTSIDNNGIKFNSDKEEKSPLPPSDFSRKKDTLIQPSQDKNRVHTSISRGNVSNLIQNSGDRETSSHLVSAHGVIDSSLATAGEKVGLSDDMVVELTEIFAWDIDFANNLQAGDQFTVVYEAGAGKAHNKIIAAQFINNGKTYTAIRYKDKEGIVSYYTPEGRSTRKAFLSTPVDFAKVSSHFSTHRRHPILNRIRAHKGVDYAARTGTPVKAAGDGVITFHGTQGGYGNMIVISHGDHYETAYAHLSRFRKDLQDGEPVKQGELIGYVGQTGLATGPHLHYEFRVDGVHRDPENLDSKQAMRLGDEEWDNFHAQTTPVLTQLNQAKANGLIAKK